MGTSGSLSLAHRSTNTPSSVPLLDMRALGRRELAAAEGATEKDRQNRTVPFSFGGVAVGLTEQLSGNKNRLRWFHFARSRIIASIDP
jgi:hypothetical protein